MFRGVCLYSLSRLDNGKGADQRTALSCQEVKPIKVSILSYLSIARRKVFQQQVNKLTDIPVITWEVTTLKDLEGILRHLFVSLEKDGLKHHGSVCRLYRNINRFSPSLTN